MQTLARLAQLARDVSDATELAAMATAEGDPRVLDDVQASLPSLEARLRHDEVRARLTGPLDQLGCFVQVRADDGGGWASHQLARMLWRWGDTHGYAIECVSYVEDDEGHLRTAVMRLDGSHAFGLLRGEAGIHRLVRDGEWGRESARFSVEVWPDVADDCPVAIDPEDLEWWTLRCGRSCGHNVNKSMTAVRLTHLPTGTVIVVDAERSQLKNRQMAMRLLQARLALRATGGDIVSTTTIRTYTRGSHPRVRDLRTGHERADVEAVLDGDLDGFLEAYVLAPAGCRPAGGGAARTD